MEPPIASPWGDSAQDPEEEPEAAVIPELPVELRARIRKSDYGRGGGWVVELDGEPVLLFNDCAFVEMFWDGYHVTRLTQDEFILARIRDLDFFFEPGVVFRNREFPEMPPISAPLVHLSEEGDFATVRGLYFVIDPPPPYPAPSLWQRLMKWLGYSSP